MPGIYILNQEEVLADPAWLLPSFVVSLVIIALCIFMIMFASEEAATIICAAATLIGILFVVAIGSGEIKEPTGRYRYEVIITEEAGNDELLEQYEIVEQRGSIVVLEDR